MKNILKLMIIFLIIPFLAYSATNREKQQRQARMRNNQSINRLINLGRSYNNMENLELKEKIGKKIDMEVNYWYMQNSETIMSIRQEEALETGAKISDILSQENIKKTKEELSSEIKKGRMPELILKTLPPQSAEMLKQRITAENDSIAKAKKQNEKQKEKQKSKGLKLFKK